MTFGITTEIDRACHNFGLTVERIPHPGESDCHLSFPIGILIGHIKSTAQTMADLRDPKCT